MLNKLIPGAAVLAALAISSAALAGERDFNTAAGAIVGAAIGSNSGARDGVLVGAVLGAAVGSSLSVNDGGYRSDGYYTPRTYQPAPVYYEPAPVYYAPPPRYYAPPAVVYVEPAQPSYRRHHERRWEDRRDERDDGRHEYGYGYHR